ncbi:MAG: carboxypeptidase regulatory-like domain-containing protein [Candidatus Sulfopaludibacter sp.]|nr:carboxypeptidase regulatory-like domain-containing protein [Candidatus Sulfopaludibacter sp.]
MSSRCHGFSGAAVLTLVLAACLGVPRAGAQQDRATIEGIVTDSSGALIADAQVSVVHVETNDEVLLRTNETGRYFAPNLPIGTYRVKVSKPGFNSTMQDRIQLQAQSSVRVDLKLTVGDVSETVTVQSVAPLVDASTATISATLTNQQVEDLPVINLGAKRNIGQWLQFMPGVNSSTTWGARVNGANGGNTEVFLDGAPASQGNVRGGFQETGPDVATVGEFSIITNSFNAEYGRTGSWLMNVVIKSGTNQLHGSVYDLFANDALNARSFFQAKRGKVRQNDGGFTLGGPVYIPKVYDGRNKTFFFFGQELFYYRTAGSTSLTTVPTAAFRTGDFSNLANASGAVIPIFDPNSTVSDGKGGFVRTQFPGNVIPASRISPISSAMVQMMLPPDLPGQQFNFYPRGGTIFDNRVTTIKIDHNFNPQHKLSLTTTLQTRPGDYSGQGWGINLPIDGSQDPKNVQSFDARVNYDYIIRPNLLNHLVLGGDGMNNHALTVGLGQGWDSKLGIAGLPNDPGMFPVVNFGGGTASPLGLGGSNYSNNVSSRLDLTENLSWIVGRHTLKFGFNIIRERYKDFEGGGASGVFGFTNLTTSQPDSSNFNQWGSSLASFLLGSVNNTNTTTISDLGWRINYQAFFLQDEWRANSRLTISYGVRWERYPGIYEEHDRATSFDPNTANPAAGGIPGALIFAGSGPGRDGRRAFANTWQGFAPRLGIAYELNPKTVIRASGGMFNAPGMTQRIDATGFTATPSFSSPDSYTPVYNWANPWPQNWNRPPILNPSFANGQGVAAILPGAARPPQILTWTFSVQRELAHSTAVEASYIGSDSTHLELGGNLTTYMNVLNPAYLSRGSLLNQSITSSAAQAAGFAPPFAGFTALPNTTVGQALRPFPQYTNITMPYSPEGISNYNALQLKLTQRLSKGLTLLAFYTRSKLMTNDDVAPIDLGEGAGSIQNPLNRRGEYSVSQDDYPNSARVTFTYQLPFGPRGQFLKQGGLVGRLAGGWELAGSVLRQSGPPLSISGNSSLSQFGYPTVRASYVSGQSVYGTYAGSFNPAVARYLNSNAFFNPAAFQLGNDGRVLSWVRGPAANSEALSLQKSITVTEHVTSVLRADATNPFNIVRWSNPNTSITSASFGVISGSQTARVVQLSLTVSF